MARFIPPGLSAIGQDALPGGAASEGNQKNAAKIPGSKYTTLSKLPRGKPRGILQRSSMKSPNATVSGSKEYQ